MPDFGFGQKIDKSSMEFFLELLGGILKEEKQKAKQQKAHKFQRNKKNYEKDFGGQRNIKCKNKMSNEKKCKKASAKLHGQQISKKHKIAAETNIKNFLEISDAFITSINKIKDDNFAKAKIVPKLSQIQKIIEDVIMNEKLYDEFLKRVNCPFCLEVLKDKMNLVLHLDTICKPHKEKLFEKIKNVPFSAVQILPNNFFKCNICPKSVFRTIKQLFDHSLSENHVFEYNKAKQNKNITEFLFCSCCKILVSNNYSEISFHINDSEHEFRTISKKKIEFFAENKILFSYLENKKYKCFACPEYFVFNTFDEVIKHKYEENHSTNAEKKMLESFYCEPCIVTLKTFDRALYHFTSKNHEEKDMKEINKQMDSYCIFCGYKCESLLKLSNHMKSECVEINWLRNSVNGKNEKLNLQNKKKKDDLIEVDNQKENIIYITGLFDVQKGYLFFKKFGEISRFEKINKEVIMLQFKEKKAFNDVMIMKNLIKIDGNCLKISDTLDIEPVEKSEEMIEDQEAKEEYLSNESETESDTEENSSDEEDEETQSPVLFDDASLEALFQKVSSKLLMTEKIEIGLEDEITLDCLQTFKCKKCIFVGFHGSDIHFSDDALNLFCDFDGSFLDDSTPDCMFVELKQKNIESCLLSMLSSNLWEVKELTPRSHLPLINCIHKKSQKECTITSAHCFRFLTNMLRSCVASNECVKPFIIIIKFWFKLHKLHIGNLEFVLISLLVYFLLSKKIVTIPNKKNDIHYRISQMTLKEEPQIMAQASPSNSSKIWSIVELFKLFLSFLHTFNFKDYAICLPIEHPVPKRVLTSKKVKMSLNLEKGKFLENSSVCILVPFWSENLAADVSEDDLMKLLKVVSATVAHYVEK